MTPTLSEARTAIAGALDAIPGLNVKPRPLRNPRAGDGWVLVGRIEPHNFGSYWATFTVFIMLAADEKAAEDKVDQLSTAAIGATADLYAADVVLEPALILVGENNTQFYALTLTLSMEVS